MVTIPLTSFLDSHGNTVRLGKRVGSGGEGDVFELLSEPGTTVAKIYKKPLTPDKQEKLRLMARGCNDELKGISAWPTDVLYTRPGGPVAGFLMPRIADAEPIHKVYGPTHRKETFPHADWRFLVRAAKNLAAAFYVIHKYGYVIGDVNEGNILVNDKACVRLIDCDSFQVRSCERLYYCEVGVAQFTPPEIQTSGDFRHERTENHDNFGLAVLIFQLLFLGRHPYAGVYPGKEDMPLEKAIAGFRFAYGRNAAKRSIAPPPNSVGPAIVPDQIAELFERAFAESGARNGGRPTAEDWWDVLDPFEARLRRCSADSVHHYYAGLSSCPWCRLEDASGVLLFLSADSITKIDLKREWQRVEAIRPPGPLPVIGPDLYRPRPVPIGPVLERSLDFRKVPPDRRRCARGRLPRPCAWRHDRRSPPGPRLRPDRHRPLLLPGKGGGREETAVGKLETARYMWKLWLRKWEEEAGDTAFRARLDRLRELKRTYEAIDRQVPEQPCRTGGHGAGTAAAPVPGASPDHCERPAPDRAGPAGEPESGGDRDRSGRDTCRPAARPAAGPVGHGRSALVAGETE